MSSTLRHTDPEVYALVHKQEEHELSTLKLIASENFASAAVREATGSIFTNKYSEGYPGARYYEGNEVPDEVEDLARRRLCTLFRAEHANVQPYSGSPANQAVYRALLNVGDKVMGMPVPEGGHLTHGWTVNFSGMDYTRVPYGVDTETGLIDYDAMYETAIRERPKLIWIGCTAYPRIFDYERVATIAAEVEAYLVADMAHIGGLVAGGVHPNPVPYCDAVTSTSHKTFRGPRGAFILCRTSDRYQQKYHADSKFGLARRVDRAVFPGLQGGPHINAIAAIAVAAHEASRPEFKAYVEQVVKNAKTLASALMEHSFRLVSGGTDNHMMILDFKDEPFSGKEVARALARCGIITNFNMVPGDTRKPFVTSGVRIGTPSVTTMGMKEREMVTIAELISHVCRHLNDEAEWASVRRTVQELCAAFVPPNGAGGHE